MTDREIPPADHALAAIDELARQIGPRRPTSSAERQAAEALSRRLGELGIGEVRLEEFRGYSSFGYPFLILLGLASLPGALASRRRGLRSALAVLAGALLAGEGTYRMPLVSRLLSRNRSQNVVGEIAPAEDPARTVVLMAHHDTSRSGLIFHPSLVRWLGHSIAAQTVSVSALAVLEPLLGGSRLGRLVNGLVRMVPFGGLLALIERELAGCEVQGANDNASGCGVVVELAAELAERPLQRTRVVLLITGCEESGTLGVQRFLESHDTAGWIFINFDNVGGSCPVRYLAREGVLIKFDADEGLVEAAAAIAANRPELGLEREDAPAGLTYDTTPVIAGGGRGMTISVQDGYIPDLHRTTDRPERIDPASVAATVEVGRELLAAADRGELD